jgi:alkaline phosphatase D
MARLRCDVGRRIRGALLGFVAGSSALCPSTADGQPDAGLQYAPPDAFLPGDKLPYFGSEGEWGERFFKPTLEEEYDRPGQVAVLYLMRGRPDDAIAYTRARIARFPDDLESRFVLPLALAQKGERSDAIAALRQALDAGVPVERFMAGPRILLRGLADTPEFRQWVLDRASPIIHGPMLGAVTDRSADIWVRTRDEVEVAVRVKDVKRGRWLPRASRSRSDTARDLTAVVKVAGLEPSTAYEYELSVNGRPVALSQNLRFSTFPPAGATARLSVGLGGCAPYNPALERVWDEIARQNYAAFLFLGDNVYIDLPEEAGPVHDYSYYRRQSRPEFRRFTASTPVFAIWDDHDCAIDDVFFGPFRDRPAWKPSMLRLFERNWPNPAFGFAPEWPGVWFRFTMGAVEFFMLDVRYYRENWRKAHPSMLGPVQKEWLLRGLRESRATFKVIASGVPWALDAKVAEDKNSGPFDTWYGYAEERREIFSFLSEHDISGVLLLSGDRHRSDVRLHRRERGYPLYELESCNLTRPKGIPPVGETVFTYSEKASFAALHFDTTLPDPSVRMEVLTIDGESVFQRTLPLSELGGPVARAR